MLTTTQVARVQEVGQVADDRVVESRAGVTTAIRTWSRASPRASGGTVASLARGHPEPCDLRAAHAGTAASSEAR